MKTKLAIALLCVMLSGCMQIVKKDAQGNELIKVNLFLYDLDLNRLVYKELEIDRAEGESKNVKVITPYGIVETESEGE